ncbi:rhomboid family intramembrane serine protease [Halobacteriales archaeon QS_3_64_16]|nr:MAG: rhomboid family intramembrane serine protease [Halobacteriales archaeon QS_3_64_16]
MASFEVLAPRLAVVLAAACSIVLVWWLDDVRGERVAALRSRFLLGVPWATLLVLAFVLAVYLFAQDGIDSWYSPVVIPFRAWSYLYPLGMLTAPFSHAGSGHLLGNLVGTLTFAPIAEYAWGHYPDERDGSLPASALQASPVGRILLFVLAVLAVGLLTSFFALGPVIGFSGVVFAFAGVAVVFYPLATVIALAAGNVLQLLYSALSNPVTVASASPSFAPPWWAGIAIQGHALGLLCGVLAGVLLIRRREHAPSAFSLWVGVLLLGVSQSLWAVYWYRGGETFVLFRAVGTVLVFALAGLVAVGVATPDRLSLADRDRGQRSALDVDLGLGDTDIDVGRSVRRVATAVLVASLIGMAVPAVPVNLTAVSDEQVGDASGNGVSASPVPSNALSPNGSARDSDGTNDSNASNASALRANGTIEIRGYTIRYAERVQNQLVSVIDVSAFGETTAVNTSGVIVTNADREIWTTAVSKSRLGFAGSATVRVGGVGWAEVVGVRRSGWSVAGGNSTYKVFLQPNDDDRRLAYAAPPAIGEPVLDGKNVSIAPRRQGFAVVVSRNDTTLERAPIPRKNGSVSVAGLTFERDEGRLLATYGTTELQIAERETYPGS